MSTALSTDLWLFPVFPGLVDAVLSGLHTDSVQHQLRSRSGEITLLELSEALLSEKICAADSVFEQKGSRFTRMLSCQSANFICSFQSRLLLSAQT